MGVVLLLRGFTGWGLRICLMGCFFGRGGVGRWFILGGHYRWGIFGVIMLVVLGVVVFGWVAIWGGYINGHCSSKEREKTVLWKV